MRQIWIFFAPGVGGDGLANLIELCDGMSRWRVNPDQPVWRVHRVVDDSVKFWAPQVDREGCFRTGERFDQRLNQINAEYASLVYQRQNLVVTSHDILLHHLDRSDRQDIFCCNQMRVLLDCRDYQSSRKNHIKKNLMTMPASEVDDVEATKQDHLYKRYAQCDRSLFDHVIWIEDLDDPSYLQQWLGKIDLTLDPGLVAQYHLLRSGQWRQVLGRVQGLAPVFESYVDQGQIRYRSLESSVVDQ